MLHKRALSSALVELKCFAHLFHSIVRLFSFLNTDFLNFGFFYSVDGLDFFENRSLSHYAFALPLCLESTEFTRSAQTLDEVST